MVAEQGQIRIIAGQWRSRRLRFRATPDLRPSPDAARETLFNWLQQDIAEMRCLDLFAGSGALGFEAASRGAEQVTMIEAHPLAAKQLVANCNLLGADALITVVQERAEKFLARAEETFDLVFLDPPFSSDLLGKVCDLLTNNSLLATNALIYIETAKRQQPLPISVDWHIIRQKARGNVLSSLIQT